MFDRIVDPMLPRRLARRSAWSAVAAVAQCTFVGGVAFATVRLAAPAPVEPAVEVRFLAAAALPRPAAPPAPVAVLTASHRAALARPGVRTVKPPPPSALLQPREVAPEMKMPAPDEPIEAWDPAPAGAPGAEEGVVGGVVAPMPAAADAARAGPGDGIEEAPQWLTSGFRRPAEVEPGCVAAAIRLPPELAGYVSGPLTVKFAVGRDGQVGRIQVVGAVPDRRIEGAIVRALQSCRWRPGADARGEPIAIWVILPIRFEAG